MGLFLRRRLHKFIKLKNEMTASFVAAVRVRRNHGRRTSFFDDITDLSPQNDADASFDRLLLVLRESVDAVFPNYVGCSII